VTKVSSRTILAASPSEVFAFYADVSNVPAMTPPDLQLEVRRAETPLKEGSRVLFAIRPSFIPFEMLWLLRIVDFVPGEQFAESLIDGPFDRWTHRHEFRALPDGRTEVTDTIEFGALKGMVRYLATGSFVKSRLEDTFRHRERVLKAKWPDR
jgi:uncharacterized protein